LSNLRSPLNWLCALDGWLRLLDATELGGLRAAGTPGNIPARTSDASGLSAASASHGAATAHAMLRRNGRRGANQQNYRCLHIGLLCKV
jgi:hypothetical protein